MLADADVKISMDDHKPVNLNILYHRSRSFLLVTVDITYLSSRLMIFLIFSSLVLRMNCL